MREFWGLTNLEDVGIVGMVKMMVVCLKRDTTGKHGVWVLVPVHQFITSCSV